MRKFMKQTTRRFYTFFMLLALVLGAFSQLPQTASAVLRDDEADPAQVPFEWAVTGPMGGDVRSLVIDPQDAQRLYLGTLDGQI